MTAARRRASTRVLGASLEAPAATHWAISERDGGCSIAVSAEATAAARSLLGLGVDQGPIDVNVLPLLADLNIGAGETAGDVAVDVARLALKHRLGLAQGEARAITRREPGAVARLASTLDIGARAVTASLQPIGIDDDVRAALAHLRQAHAAALGWGRGEREQLASRGEHINALLDRYHSLPERELLCVAQWESARFTRESNEPPDPADLRRRRSPAPSSRAAVRGGPRRVSSVSRRA